jgi:DNA polymerase
LKREFKRVTGLDMATTARFLPWAREHGYPFNDMRKDSVRRALEQGVSDELRYALEIRGDLNRTSLAKYEVLAEAQYQGRLYHSFQFGGAARTLRWAGRKVQPQNLARPIKALDNRIEEATDLVRAGEYDELYMRFGRVTPVLVSLVRSSFRAPEGRVLGVADYNAIENRVIGWTAECEATLAIFKNNLDPYKSFGTRLYNKAYDTITKDERNNSKAPVLGGGYRLGGGDEKANKNGDVLKTGLWGYAEAMGIKLTRDEAHRAVAVFRETFPAIVKLWYRLEDAAHYAVEQHLTTQVGPVVFDYQPGVMRIRLPSGRYLHYLRPKYIEKEFEGRDGAYVKRVLTYDGMDSTPGGNKKWGRLTTHGGKLTENIVQAIARDVLAVGMTRAKRAGFEIIGHAHDEIIVEMPAKPLMGVGVLCELMSQPIGWAPGLPLKAEGFESAFYRK